MIAAAKVFTDRPWLYLRSPSGTLHLRQRMWPDDETGPDGNGLSATHSRCGWHTYLGSAAIPSRLSLDGGDHLCRRCAVVEP